MEQNRLMSVSGEKTQSIKKPIPSKRSSVNLRVFQAEVETDNMKKLKVMMYQLSSRFDKLESKLEQPEEGRKSTKSVETSSNFQRGKFASRFARGQGRRI